MKLIWSRRAVRDLVSIGDYIAQDNLSKAKEQIVLIRKRVKLALRFPKSGRVVPEFGKNTIREFILGNYRIVYEIKSLKIVVLTVFEGHHLMPMRRKSIQ